eukprot:1024942-Pyramimonas_sp.AAC.2
MFVRGWLLENPESSCRFYGGDTRRTTAGIRGALRRGYAAHLRVIGGDARVVGHVRDGGVAADGEPRPLVRCQPRVPLPRLQRLPRRNPASGHVSGDTPRRIITNRGARPDPRLANTST